MFLAIDLNRRHFKEKLFAEWAKIAISAEKYQWLKALLPDIRKAVLECFLFVFVKPKLFAQRFTQADLIAAKLLLYPVFGLYKTKRYNVVQI